MQNEMKRSIVLPDFEHAPIDIHSHFNHGSHFDCPENEIHTRGINFVESVYLNANVSQVGISTFASFINPQCIIEENLYLHRLIQEKEWVYQ